MALATRCPHCETGSVWIRICSRRTTAACVAAIARKSSDARITSSDRDETVMRAGATRRIYGRTGEPVVGEIERPRSRGKRDARGMALHPLVSDTALAPQAQADRTDSARGTARLSGRCRSRSRVAHARAEPIFRAKDTPDRRASGHPRRS